MSTYKSMIQRQGRMHEDAALEHAGGDAVNLNDVAREGQRGGNYPTFDLSSSSEITSVKSHISQPGQTTEQDINSYKSDFSHMLGYGRGYEEGKSPLQQDAERIRSLQDKGVPTPTQLDGASQEDIENYLKHDTIMRIPDDQVGSVRQSLETDIRNLPENYYLPENPTDEQVNSVLNRIQGTGLTTTQTAEQLQSEGYPISAPNSQNQSSQANINETNQDTSQKSGQEVNQETSQETNQMAEQQPAENTQSPDQQSPEGGEGSEDENYNKYYGLGQ